MKIWVLGPGVGAGEAAFAAAFARAAERAGLSVRRFGEPATSRLVLGADAEGLPSPTEFAARAVLERPAAVVFTTSGTCGPWIAAMPPGPLLASVECTWMMWAWTTVPWIAPLTRAWVCLPDEVFERGLVEDGGPFRLAPQARERLVPVGWAEPAPEVAPSATVLLYFGQRVAGESFPWGAALAGAIERVAAERPSLTWRYVGTRDVALPPLVERVPFVAPDAFRAAVASARLVVCHHGMATISTAAAAGTPVVALADGRSWRAGAMPEWSDQEVWALERAGVVRACYGRAPVETLARRLRAALDAPRPPRPEAEGAERAVRELLRLLGRFA